MLLAAHFEAAFELVGRAPERGLGVAAFHMHRRQHIVFQGVRFVHADHGVQRLDLELDQAGGAPRGHDVVCDHQGNDLADELHRVQREDGFVVRKGGQGLVAGDVAGIDHRVHAGQGQCRAGVDLAQDAVGHG